MDRLTLFCRAMYLLARFNPSLLEGAFKGRQWERWASEVLGSVTSAHQGPGSLTLFGRRSASGVRHEFDAAGGDSSWTLIAEAKAYGESSPSKKEICCFDRKTFDTYVERRLVGERGPHFRVLVSAGPVDDDLRRYCFLYGIVTVDPGLIPLPVLLRMAGRAVADEYFSDAILSELVRLAEPACASMELRYVPDGPDHLRFDIRRFSRRDLNDLLWLQKTVSGDLLELVDVTSPGYFEDLASVLIARLGLEPALT